MTKIPSNYLHRRETLPKHCSTKISSGKKTLFLIDQENFTEILVDGTSQAHRQENNVDREFARCLVVTFRDSPFFRGNLDAGRLNFWFGKGIIAADPEDYDPCSYSAMLQLTKELVEKYK